MPEEIILIVDDDISHLGLVERYVESYGLNYESVTNGFAAIRFLETNPNNFVYMVVQGGYRGRA